MLEIKRRPVESRAEVASARIIEEPPSGASTGHPSELNQLHLLWFDRCNAHALHSAIR